MLQVSHFMLHQQAGKLHFCIKVILIEAYRRVLLYKGNCLSPGRAREKGSSNQCFCDDILRRDFIHSVHVAVHKVHEPVRS